MKGEGRTIPEQLSLFDGEFTTEDAYEASAHLNVRRESVRARIYEAIDDGRLRKVARGVYENGSVLLVNGDGRDLSFIRDGSIDAIVTDHPYDVASNVGRNRHLANYECFRYGQGDFDEKARVLKDGAFLVEFLPEEGADNWRYLSEIKEMAEKAGLAYYAKVPWVKTGFVSNMGRKSHDSEDVMIFSKGRARALRPNHQQGGLMSGSSEMLPAEFDYPKPADPIHQAEKPVALLERILELLTLPDETALDQFAGSGALGDAAQRCGRKAILIEKDERFFEAEKRRLSAVRPAIGL